MKKNKFDFNIIIDVILLMLIMLTSITGFIVNYVLPCGHSQRRALAHDICGMGRHDIGYIHWIIAVLLLVFLVIHIFQHWNMVSAYFTKKIPNQTARGFFYLLLFCCILLTCIPWLIVIFS